jgi:hypothetical protein
MRFYISPEYSSRQVPALKASLQSFLITFGHLLINDAATRGITAAAKKPEAAP